MKKKILIHIHVYYPDLFQQLADIVEGIVLPKKIVITYIDKNINQELFKKRFPCADIRLVENVGYDIKPFIDVMNSENLDEYSYVLKLHTKRDYDGDLSNYHLDNGVCVGGTKWRDYLLEPFSKKNWNKTLQTLNKHNVGAVGNINCLMSETKDHPYYKEPVQNFTKQFGLKYKPYAFFAGTMFLAHAKLLKILRNLPKNIFWNKSDGNKDWHDDVFVFERVLGEIMIAQNKKLVGVCKPYAKQTKSMWRHLNLIKIKHDGDQSEKIIRIYCCRLRILKTIEQSDIKKYYIFNIHLFNRTKNVVVRDTVEEYAKWMEYLHNDKSMFVPITDKPFKRQKNTPKIFAYYLTQFHAIPENDDAHGKGFTEWTNVASASPQFVGHYQPKIPYDVGFYNLLDINVMKRQAELAKMYGVYGWCFYYYWFSGKKVLEKPLYNFLESDIDLPFHLCWANENWSKLWDGGDKEVILEQKLQDGDAEKFFADILPFIKDKRYEKIDNRPLLMIYRPALFEKNVFKKFIDTLEKLAKQNGFDGFYFMASNAFKFQEPKEYGCRGLIEFPPHGLSDVYGIDKHFINPNTNLSVFGLGEYIKKQKNKPKPNYTLFKCCFPNWDNSPRKVYSGGGVFELTDDEFAQWLSGIITSK